MGRPRNEDRTKRVPLGSLRSKLTIPEGLIDKARYVGRWLVDRPGRLEAAKEGGYTPVMDPDMKVEVGEGTDGRDQTTTTICRNVGTHSDGKPMKAYLHKIRKDWYEADQAEKQKGVNETDKMIQEGNIARQPNDKRYIGSQGIKYKP